MSKEPIDVKCLSKWDHQYSVPSFEVRRCMLLQLPMRIIHEDPETGDLINDIIVPCHRLDEGIKTGIMRTGKISTGKDGGGEAVFELINFRISDFVEPENKKQDKNEQR